MQLYHVTEEILKNRFTNQRRTRW